ncbi:uncharacterized protein JCM6883_002554 [Sporobolomyces salmoneus]|uniref:uncharacterized protein n=1 Tax=Sporobolomyces salmoneus TaxID=183962 RepID=UPI003172DA08
MPSRTATPHVSRPSTPSHLDAVAGRSNSRPHSRPGTPQHAPSRLQRDYEHTVSNWIKAPPNNTQMEDPSLQFRANDLLSNPNTEPTKWGDPVSHEEMEKIKELAEKLAK